MSGRKHAIACSSGTAALHLAMLALDIGHKDAVIVPALAYIATANAVRYCGATVLFADIDPDDWCIDLSSVHNLTTGEFFDRRKQHDRSIVVPVHLYDAVAKSSQIELIGRFPAWVVDDCAHCPQIIYQERSKPVFSVYSFYASKIIACGEGGMVTTDDERLAYQIRLYRGQGATIPGRYHHEVVGYNYRMTDLQAAIGLAQLERLDELLGRRREIVNRYRSNLVIHPSITLQGGELSSAWTCAVLIPSGVDREDVIESLLTQGVETRPFFEPLPSLPPYESEVPPVAAEVSRRGICLPVHVELTNNDIDYVCEQLLGAINGQL